MSASPMAEYGEQHGFSMVTLEEHHGAENGWSPSPLVMAGLIFGRTKTIGVNLSALLVPLHDPLRVAEDIAVLDLASGGRFSLIGGIGYRPSEYAMHRKDWSKRGQLMDECVDAMTSRLEAELDWSRGFEKRLRDGAYHFADDGVPEIVAITSAQT